MKYTNGNFHQLPDNLHLAVKDVYEMAVLNYLIQCSDGAGECFPSYQTLSQGLMTRRRAITTIQSLAQRQIITIKTTPFKVNTYTINHDRLVNLIHQCTTFTSEPSAPTSECHSPLLVNDVHPNHTHINHTQLTKPITLSNARAREDKKAVKKPYGEFNNVLLTDVEYSKLIERYGETEALKAIENLSSGIESKGYRYKSHYATILTWQRHDGEKQRNEGVTKAPVNKAFTSGGPWTWDDSEPFKCPCGCETMAFTAGGRPRCDNCGSIPRIKSTNPEAAWRTR